MGKDHNYVALLAIRAKKLEWQVRRARTRKGSRTVGPANPASPILLTRTLADGAGFRQKEAADVDDLVSDFGFL